MIPNLIDVQLLQKQKILKLEFDNGKKYDLSCEYLRVYSPSAEVRGHSKNDAVLQFVKKEVNIISIEMVGNYALKFIFDDGHDTGIYSFDYLFELADRQVEYWQSYLEKLSRARLKREG